MYCLGWFNDKWGRATHAVSLLWCSKPLFCFYKHVFQWFFFFYNRSRVAPWKYLWVFVFKSAICAWLCFPKFGIDGWVKLPDTKGSSSFYNFRFLFYSFFSVFILNFSEGLFYHLLRVASGDQACQLKFSIFSSMYFTINLTQAKGSLSVNFITYFMVIQTKTYVFHVSTLPKSIHDKTMAKKRWSLPKTLFLGVKTTFRHTFPSSDLQCLPLDDPRVLCTNTGIRLLATHLFWWLCPSGFTVQSASMAHAWNGCSQSSRFLTAGQGERRLWEWDWVR